MLLLSSGAHENQEYDDVENSETLEKWSSIPAQQQTQLKTN